MVDWRAGKIKREEKAFSKWMNQPFSSEALPSWEFWSLKEWLCSVQGARRQWNYINTFQGFHVFRDNCTSSPKQHLNLIVNTRLVFGCTKDWHLFLSLCLKSCGIEILGCAMVWYVKGGGECRKGFWQIERKPFESYLTVGKGISRIWNSIPTHPPFNLLRQRNRECMTCNKNMNEKFKQFSFSFLYIKGRLPSPFCLSFYKVYKGGRGGGSSLQ